MDLLSGHCESDVMDNLSSVFPWIIPVARLLSLSATLFQYPECSIIDN